MGEFECYPYLLIDKFCSRTHTILFKCQFPIPYVYKGWKCVYQVLTPDIALQFTMSTGERLKFKSPSRIYHFITSPVAFHHQGSHIYFSSQHPHSWASLFYDAGGTQFIRISHNYIYIDGSFRGITTKCDWISLSFHKPR